MQGAVNMHIEGGGGYCIYIYIYTYALVRSKGSPESRVQPRWGPTCDLLRVWFDPQTDSKP